MTDLIEQFVIKVGVEVLDLEPPLTCHLRPLAAGLNFLSDAYFATLKGQTSTTLFVKVPPMFDEMKKGLFNSCAEMLVFEREVYIYNQLKIKFGAEVKKIGESEDDFLSMIPTSHHLPGQFSYERARTEPIVLENLGGRGYSMWKDEIKGLDLKHTLKVVEAQARYHAVGAAFLVKHGLNFEEPHIDVLFNMDFEKVFNEDLKKMVDSGFQMFLDYMEKEGKDTESILLIKEMLKDRNYVKEMSSSIDIWDSYPFQTIIHGDSRANNYMFKYGSDGHTPVDVKFVDFQSSFRTVPYYDLVYFFTTSVPYSVLGPELDNILGCYHNSLAGSLARLNYPNARPSVATIKKDMRRVSRLILPIAMSCVFIVISGNPGWSQEEKDGKLEETFQVAKVLGMI